MYTLFSDMFDVPLCVLDVVFMFSTMQNMFSTVMRVYCIVLYCIVLYCIVLYVTLLQHVCHYS